jgi:phosphonopyruvate decarboxylase
MAGARTMIDCCRFVDAMRSRGWSRACGVPCRTFSGPIAHLSAAGYYEVSANEGLALSSAAGAALAGRHQAVFLQNSGLGNLINPLVSLVLPYQLPVLAFMSLRGWPDPDADEPQHAVMGAASMRILEALGVWHSIVDGDAERFSTRMDQARQEIERGRPAFLLVPPGVIGTHPAAVRSSSPKDLPTSADVAGVVSQWVEGRDVVVVATTGYLSRHLFASGDREANFYMQGSMGHAAAIGLGYCQSRPGADVVVVDGDGAVLMHLGVLSAIGAVAPPRLTHIIVDNGSYASTGGQATTAPHTDLAGVATACGYRTSQTVESKKDMEAALQAVQGVDGPHGIIVRARAGEAAAPARASASVPLPDIARRLRTRDTGRG